MRQIMVVLTILAAISGTVLLFAHEGHAHHVMGTVTAIDAKHIEVKGEDGKVVSCEITADTKVARGETAATVAEIKPGERVMINTEEHAGKVVAHLIRLGKATPGNPGK